MISAAHAQNLAVHGRFITNRATVANLIVLIGIRAQIRAHSGRQEGRLSANCRRRAGGSGHRKLTWTNKERRWASYSVHIATNTLFGARACLALPRTLAQKQALARSDAVALS